MDENQRPGWSEADSAHFLEIADLYVPDRLEQTATICDLVPAPAPDGEAHLVDLCCGEGLLSDELLRRFPGATVHGYDGSTAMLERAAARIAASGGQGGRFVPQLFDLRKLSWRIFPWPVHAIVSSLAIHHLDSAGKLNLFHDLYAALAPGGVLVIADLIRPATEAGTALAARVWDEAVRRRSIEETGNLVVLERFRAERWNFYTDPAPDPGDRPSTLFEQLTWLREVGFTGVDVFWMKAGHAIFGGVRGR